MNVKNDIFEGLHVLLVTEDDSRAQALAKALRDRKANVGDVKAGARDPVALRGADLILVDARTADQTRSRLAEMRADVRARWASVATLDYGKLVLDDGAIYLSPLEEAIGPLIAADRALTERARKEGVFEATLAPLGPSRTLRALALAGPTLHVTMQQADLSATVCLSNELLVCAFVERGDEKFEAWAALARVLGLSDAQMHIEKRAHPTAMNIMEPINQALEVAAQERQSSANLTKVMVDKQAEVSDLPAVKPGASSKRTMLGIAPGGPAPRPAARAEASKPAAAAKHGQRTMMGIAPAASAPVAVSKHSPEQVKQPTPDNDVAPRPKSRPDLEPVPMPQVASATEPRRPKSRPDLEPVALDEAMMPRAKATPDLAQGMRAPSRKSPARPEPTPGGGRSRPELKPVELPAEPVPVRMAHVEAESGMGAKKETFGDEATARATLGTLERVTFGDMPTDPSALKAGDVQLVGDVPLPAPVKVPPPPPPPKLEEPRQLAEPPSSVRQEVETKPFDSRNLMAAIEEEVPEDSHEGSQQLPVDPVVRRQIQEETLIIVRREQRKSRAMMLFFLFLVVVGQYYFMRYMNERDAQMSAARVGQVELGQSPSRKIGAAQAEPAVPAAAAATPAAEAANAAPVAEAAPAAAKQPEPQPAPEPVAEQPAPEPVAEPAPAAAAAAEPAGAREPDKSGSTDAQVREGMKLLGEGNAAGAKDALQAATSADPKNPHAQAGLAEALFKLGDHDAALAAINEAIKLRPKRARYRVQLGDILKAQGKAGEARAAYKKGIEIDPNEREAVRRMAESL